MKRPPWIQMALIWRLMIVHGNPSENSTLEIEDISEKSQETNDYISDDTNTDDDVVITTYGPVQGHIQEDTPEIKRYYDIPYGSFSEKNPFEAPTPPGPWEQVHHETEHKSRCPQIEHPDKFVGNTKCLTLSIMAPLTADNADVLFHIHGGTFKTGSGDPSIYGPEYIVSKGIILVLPNYRLGAFGFLCSQNDTIPGNAALKDLTLALKWIEKNIAAFGGNPKNIVVSGEGTAGALAGYLSISPLSRSYVSKVITESGFVLSHWALDRDPIATVETLWQKMNKPIETVTSLSDKPYNYYIEVLTAASNDIQFSPCVEKGDNAFMSETPWKMLQSLKTNVPYMIGSTSHAGMQEALQQIDSSLSDINNDFGIILPDDLDFDNNDEKRKKVVNKVRTQYFGEDKVTQEHIEDLSFCFTDSSYLGPTLRAARHLVAAGAPVYFYEFSFAGELNQQIAPPIEIHGAIRGDLARYVFCPNNHVPDEDSKEKQMIDVLTELWANFIRSGKPSAEDVEWHRLEQTTETNETWLLIGSEIEPHKGLHLERLKLWTEIYEEYFVEHNRALGLSPYLYSLIFTLLLFICLSKLLM